MTTELRLTLPVPTREEVVAELRAAVGPDAPQTLIDLCADSVVDHASAYAECLAAMYASLDIQAPTGAQLDALAGMLPLDEDTYLRLLSEGRLTRDQVPLTVLAQIEEGT